MRFLDSTVINSDTFWFFGVFAFPIAIGLLSGLTHCAAMCGPIHFFLMRRGTRYGLWFYHLGRVATYAVLGVIAGTLGHWFKVPGAAWIWIALYVVMGLKILGVPLWPQSWETRYGAWLMRRLSPMMSNAESQSRSILFLPLGFAAGFLPCVTTQAGLAWAAAASNPRIGGAGMLLLGVVTLPLFLAWPRKWFPVKGSRYHILLGIGLLVLAAWRAHGVIFANHPVTCH